MNPFDRGTIKWTSLMLPEHNQCLRAWENELHDASPKEKAEWELEMLYQTIQQAHQLQMPINFTFYKQGTWQTTTGIITTIDLNKQHLLVDMYFSDAHIATAGEDIVLRYANQAIKTEVKELLIQRFLSALK